MRQAPAPCPLRHLSWATLLGFFLIPVAHSTHIVDNYTPVKWMAFYLCVALALAGYVFKPHREAQQSLRIEKPVFGVALGAVTIFFVSAIANYPTYFVSQFFDWLQFIALIFLTKQMCGSTTDWFSKVDKLNLAATAVILLEALFEAYSLTLNPGISRNEFLSSFFGFQNMTAEFIGVSILLQLAHLVEKRRRVEAVIREVLLVLSLFYLFFLSSRSAFVSLGAALAFTFIFNFKHEFVFRFARVSSIATVLVLGALQLPSGTVSEVSESTDQSPTLSEGAPSSVPLNNVFTPDIVQTKQTNKEIRLVRWRNTLKMIADRPLGVGPGNFEFGYLPYAHSYRFDIQASEELVVRSPHNGYLELVAEYGWTAAVVALFGLLMLAKLLSRRGPTEVKTMHAVLVFFAVDAFFAFPLENAFPFYAIAVALGVSWHFAQNAPATHAVCVMDGAKLRVTCQVLLVAICLHGAAFATSKCLERIPRNDSLRALACDVYPDNWRACIEKAATQLRAKQYREAESTLRYIIRRQPSHFVALRLLSQVYLYAGALQPACETVDAYDALFNFPTKLRAQFEGICKRQ